MSHKEVIAKKPDPLIFHYRQGGWIELGRCEYCSNLLWVSDKAHAIFHATPACDKFKSLFVKFLAGFVRECTEEEDLESGWKPPSERECLRANEILRNHIRESDFHIANLQRQIADLTFCVSALERMTEGL